MRKLFASAVLSFALFAAPAYFAASQPDVPQVQIVRVAQDETPTPTPSAADVAAYNAFQQWAEAHMLDGLGRFHASEDGKTITGFDLALAVVDADGDPTEIKWVVYNYPTVAGAAAQIESDYTKYPDGNPDGTEYQAPNPAENKA
jgi:hypothetical protein